MGPDTVITNKLQKAIDSVANQPKGGRLTLQPGVYCTGLVRLHSNVNLHLEKDAVLLGSINP